MTVATDLDCLAIVHNNIIAGIAIAGFKYSFVADASSGGSNGRCKTHVSNVLCCTMAAAAPGDRTESMANIPHIATMASLGNFALSVNCANLGIIFIILRRVHIGSPQKDTASWVADVEDDDVEYATASPFMLEYTGVIATLG